MSVTIISRLGRRALLADGNTFWREAGAIARRRGELEEQIGQLAAMAQTIDALAAMYTRCEIEHSSVQLQSAAAVPAADLIPDRNMYAYVAPANLNTAYEDLISPLIGE